MSTCPTRDQGRRRITHCALSRICFNLQCPSVSPTHYPHHITFSFIRFPQFIFASLFGTQAKFSQRKKRRKCLSNKFNRRRRRLAITDLSQSRNYHLVTFVIQPFFLVRRIQNRETDSHPCVLEANRNLVSRCAALIRKHRRYILITAGGQHSLCYLFPARAKGISSRSVSSC